MFNSRALSTRSALQSGIETSNQFVASPPRLPRPAKARLALGGRTNGWSAWRSASPCSDFFTTWDRGAMRTTDNADRVLRVPYVFHLYPIERRGAYSRIALNC